MDLILDTVCIYSVHRYGHLAGTLRCCRFILSIVYANTSRRKALKPSLEIDFRIFNRTVSTIVDDDSLEKFFETIPGFFKSEQDRGLERDFPETLFETFWDAMDGFIGRTSSSNSIMKSVKSRRAKICKDIMKIIPCPESFNLHSYFGQELATIEWMRAMKRWFPNRSPNVSCAAQTMVAKNIARISEDSDVQIWGPLASEVYDFPDFPKVAISRNDAMLALLIHLCRQCKDPNKWRPVEVFTQFDIRDTSPGLQHDFCTLWNELLQEATPYGTSIHILRSIRHLHYDLHEATIPALPSIDSDDLLQPSSYASCNIASYRPDSTTSAPVLPPVPSSVRAPVSAQRGDIPTFSPHNSTSGGSTALPPRVITITEHPSSSTPMADASPPGGAKAAMQQDFLAPSST